MDVDLKSLNFEKLLEEALRLQQENAELRGNLSQNETLTKPVNLSAWYEQDTLCWIYFVVIIVLICCHDRASKAIIYQAAASFDTSVTFLTSQIFVEVGWGKAIWVGLCIAPVIIQFIFFPRKCYRKGIAILASVVLLAGAYGLRHYYVSVKVIDNQLRPGVVVLAFLALSMCATLDFYNSVKPKKVTKSPKPRLNPGTGNAEQNFELQDEADFVSFVEREAAPVKYPAKKTFHIQRRR